MTDQNPAPTYDRAAWETYRRDARCGCTAPDPTDSACTCEPPVTRQCPCHYLSVVPAAAELTAAKAAPATPAQIHNRPVVDEPVPDQLTAEEARALAEELNLELFQARDSVAYALECLTIWDREQPGQPVTTARVRQWLKGAQCGRVLLGQATATPPTLASPDLRQRYADALIDHLSRTADIRPHSGDSGELAFMPEVTNSELTRIADAVMAVRDTELEELRRRAEQAEAALDRVREGEPMAPEDYDREQLRAATEQCAAGLRAFAEALAPAIRNAAQAIAQAAEAARDDYALAPPPTADTTDA